MHILIHASTHTCWDWDSPTGTIVKRVLRVEWHTLKEAALRGWCDDATTLLGGKFSLTFLSPRKRELSGKCLPSHYLKSDLLCVWWAHGCGISHIETFSLGFIMALEWLVGSKWPRLSGAFNSDRSRGTKTYQFTSLYSALYRQEQRGQEEEGLVTTSCITNAFIGNEAADVSWRGRAHSPRNWHCHMDPSS